MVDLTKRVPYDQALRLAKGSFAHNVPELHAGLKQISDLEFRKLVGKDHDFVADWLREQYPDPSLLRRLARQTDRKTYLKTIERYLGRSRPSRTDQKTTLAPIFFLTLLLLTVLFVQQCTVMKYARTQNARMAEAEQSILSQRIVIAMQENRIQELQDQEEEMTMRLMEQAEELGRAPDIPAPADRIQPGQIRTTDHRVCIDVDDPRISTFLDTNSMIPSFDVGHTGVKIVPLSSSEIQVGDVISYSLGGETIAHRVRETGIDETGWYATVQGDNNREPDEHKVRFTEISGILVGVIY